MTWPLVPLGEVLTHRKEFVLIEDATAYKRCRVQLHANGVLLRDVVPGADIKTKRQQVCRAGEFLVAEIDAKHGGFGLVPGDLAGAVVSSHYFLYGVREDKLDRRFLDYFIRTPAFREQVEAQGSTNYAAIRPADVLAYRMPLPPLAEQQRIVGRVDAIAGRLADARRLRAEADADYDSLLVAMAHRSDWDDATKERAGWTRAALSVGLRLVSDPVPVDRAATYPNLGLYSYARGPFEKPPIDGMASSATTLYRVRAGQFIYSRLFAFEGAYGLVPLAMHGRYVSNEYPTFEADPTRMRTEFVAAYFKSPQLWKDVAVGSVGIGHRRQRVHPEQILKHQLWLPPLGWQDRIAAVQAKAETLRSLQATTAADLDALLPAVLAEAFAGRL